ncbi:MAG: tetratricopeptide repeat protein [Nitrospirae bacterium]|nr:tetratricopeptide repeat protein [Nitrospirota bacterium]
MRLRPSRKLILSVVLMLIGCGSIAACASPRPLVVPTTPPSERNENPGLDQPPAASQKPSVSQQACSSAEDCFHSALQRLEDGDPATAAERFRQLREQNPESPWAKRAGFLLGQWAAESGSPEAEALFSEAITTFPHLEEYSLFFMAGGQAKGGRFQEAVQTYDRLLRKFPESVLNAQAAYQKAQVLIQTGDCRMALNELDGFVARYPKDSNSSPALLQLADCAVRVQDSAKAVWALRQIWFYYADSPEAQEAPKNLLQLGASGVSIPAPSAEARYQRGRILFDAARYDEAAAEFKAVLAAGEPANRDEIGLKLAETLIQLKQYDDAKRLLGELTARTGRPDILTSALFWLGRLAIRQGEEGRLLQIERQLADRFPASTERAKLLFMIGDFYEGRGQIEQAVKIYRRVIAEAPSDPSAEDAVWRIGWMAYKARRYGDAIKIFEDHLQRHPASLLGGQFGYWIGRSTEQIDQPLKAAQAYREVCRKFLRTFYCQEATARLARLPSPAIGGGEADRPPDPSREASEAASKTVNRIAVALPAGDADTALTRDRHYAIALELMALHLKPEAAFELTSLAERYAADKAAALRLAELLYAADNYFTSLRLLRLHFQDVIERGGDDVPKSFWEQVYPRRFVERIQRQNPSLSADPFLVAAVTREESAFNPKAVSKVGALGLMQLMPYTAEWVARQMGLTTFRPELLLDETMNVQLGAWYLNHLIRQFNGNVVLAVASYNAGPEAVGRWAEGGVGDLDEFIEAIPFNETRYFTKKVIRSYNEYLRIAGTDSTPRLSEVRARP